jgi:hypothetical protein
LTPLNTLVLGISFGVGFERRQVWGVLIDFGKLTFSFNGAMNHESELLLRYFSHYRLDLLCCKCKLNQKFCQT